MSGKNTTKPNYGIIDGRGKDKLKPSIEKLIVEQTKSKAVHSARGVNKNGIPYN
jgi:hypothetical protein